MTIRTKRWNDPIGLLDGHRLLVCLYRPRGVARGKETWHAWDPSLGPTRELHAAVYGKSGKAIGWDDYKCRYLKLMEGRRAQIEALARLSASGKTITLLCSSACTEEGRCHRSLLRALIERAEAEL